MTAPAPFLFERVGRDWRWAHGALLTAWVEEAAAALPLLPIDSGEGAAQPPAESRHLQILGRPGLALWALDRAGRDAGWVVWTAREPISSAAGEAGSRDGPTIRITGAVGHDTTHVWAPSGDPERYPSARVGSRVTRSTGGVLVRGRGVPQTWTEVELEAAAAAFSAVLEATNRESDDRRDVVVLHRDWTDPGTRRLLAWAELQGAAILFEPEPEWAFSTLVWARPTRIIASIDEILRWEPLLSTRSPRDWTRKRGPFERLRTLIVDAAGTAGGGEFELSEAWKRALAPLQIQIQVLHAS